MNEPEEEKKEEPITITSTITSTQSGQEKSDPAEPVAQPAEPVAPPAEPVAAAAEPVAAAAEPVAPPAEPVASAPEPAPQKNVPPPPLAVEVRGLRVRFGRRDALEGIDLALPEGSWTALLGPPEAGKTTLLRALLGLERWAAGEGTVLGVSPAKGLQVRAKVGYVPARPAFYPHLHSQTLGRFLADLYPGWDKERWTGLVARLGVPPREPAGDLQPGPLARLALAAALAFRPRLVLVDVPPALDAAGRRELHLALEEEARDTALIVAGGDPWLARRADRMVVLARGRVRCAGPPKDLLARAAALELHTAAELPALPPGVRALGLHPARGSAPAELLVFADEAALLPGLSGLPGVRARRSPGLEELYPALVAGDGGLRPRMAGASPARTESPP